MPIRKLPPLLISQIAAGEVIERPASIVKELVENSLDAGATRIDIVVEEGGRQLIRISDDGTGIPPEELPLAVAPHATSKLTSAEQLAAISTLGFRGEALASIASVSRLRVTSRARQAGQLADAGACLEVTGDEVSPVAPAGAAPGTVIEVRDLFFNTPARRKFMRAASTEFGHISDTISRIAMVHPGVAFRLTHGNRVTLDLSAESDRARRAVALLGQELEEGLLAFEHIDPPDRGGARLWGLAGVPALARSSSKFQYLCVNGRPIRDRGITHAVKEAYRGLMPPDKQPVAVVFIDLDPAEVDVNVHPAKAEVRFRNPSQVHGLVLSAIRQRLLATDLTPSAALLHVPPQPQPQQAGLDFAANFQAGRETQASFREAFQEQTDFQGNFRGSFRESFRGSAPEPNARSSVSSISTHEFVDYFRRMDPTQKGFVYQQVRQAIADEDPAALVGDHAVSASPALPAAAPLKILQVHKSYVVTQDDEGLLIVDQHALHERVMFEELRRRVLGAVSGSDSNEARRLESQRLLMPAIIRANPARQAQLERLQPLLERIGIEAEPIGPDAVGIQAFPSFLFDRKVEPTAFLDELLDRAEEGELDVSSPTTEEAALHEVLDMMACKAAVKAGDGMSEAELTALLAKRAEVERSSNCPHGRPTTIRLTLRDLEKHFKRA